jgi:hypothetical protein
VFVNSGLVDGGGVRAEVELLTSALGNVAGQKWATSCLWFTVNWSRVNAGQANAFSGVVEVCAFALGFRGK